MFKQTLIAATLVISTLGAFAQTTAAPAPAAKPAVTAPADAGKEAKIEAHKAKMEEMKAKREAHKAKREHAKANKHKAKEEAAAAKAEAPKK